MPTNRPLPSPLPADLPEDWQDSLIVAPEGADVGLTEQHGYNYLMQQVNDAQRAANQLGSDKQDKLMGTQGQIVGFDASGKAVAQDAPASGVTSFNGRAGAVVPQDGDYTASQVGAVPTSRTVNGKPLSSDVTLTATDVGALPTAGGTLTGDLRIKGSGNYGTKINLGDGDYVHISEPTDDNMEIKAKTIKFVTTQNSGGIDIDDLKTSVSDGKAAIASAITGKGVSTSPTATFSTMAANIGKIQTAGTYPTCNITVRNNFENTIAVIYMKIDPSTKKCTLDRTNIYSGSSSTITAVITKYNPLHFVNIDNLSRINKSFKVTWSSGPWSTSGNAGAWYGISFDSTTVPSSATFTVTAN